MAKKQEKRWVYRPSRPPKSQVPEAVKKEVSAKAQELVDNILKPRHINPPPEDERFNYLVDIYTKWYRSYFYFCAKYACPGSDAMAPYFESKFARLEYVGGERFHLSYMRHTEQWLQLYVNLTLDECLEKIEEQPYFFP